MDKKNYRKIGRAYFRPIKIGLQPLTVSFDINKIPVDAALFEPVYFDG